MTTFLRVFVGITVAILGILISGHAQALSGVLSMPPAAIAVIAAALSIVGSLSLIAEVAQWSRKVG